MREIRIARIVLVIMFLASWPASWAAGVPHSDAIHSRASESGGARARDGQDSAKQGQPLLGESDKLIDRLLQLHIAEFQALTGRSTNWITLQYGLPIFAVTAFGLIIANPSRFKPGVQTWFLALLYQGVLIAHLLVLSQLFNDAQYIECDLRPQIARLLSAGGSSLGVNNAHLYSFWGFEKYMERHSAYSPTSVYFLPLQVILAFPVALWFRRKDWGRSDLSWATASVAAAILSVLIARFVVSTNIAFMACAGK